MSLQASPLISVIVAVYNGAQTLQQCINSVAQQTYQNKELIIIDGGSNDETLELLKDNNTKINYWVSEPDKGVYSAWNKALAVAKGEWIYFLGADDYFWDKEVLKKIADETKVIPNDVNIAYGQVMLLNSQEEYIHVAGKPWNLIKKKFKRKMEIPHQAVFHRRKLFEENGCFDESFRIVGDYDLLLRELKTKDAYSIPNFIITGMRQGGISSNPQQSLIMLKELRRVELIHFKNYVPSLSWQFAVVRVYIRLFLFTCKTY